MVRTCKAERLVKSLFSLEETRRKDVVFKRVRCYVSPKMLCSGQSKKQ